MRYSPTARTGRPAARERTRTSAPTTDPRRRRPFSLLELIVAMAMGILLVGLAIAAAGRVPALMTLDDCSNGIKRVFSEALAQAIVQGRRVEVAYDMEERVFTLSSPAPGVAALSYSVPSAVGLEFPRLPAGAGPARFVFHPDGTAAGPAFRISLRGRVKAMKVSPLTGVLQSRDLTFERDF